MKTESEELFERFLNDNCITFEKIKEDTTPRPDYLVKVGTAQIIFELKELPRTKISTSSKTWRIRTSRATRARLAITFGAGSTHRKNRFSTELNRAFPLRCSFTTKWIWCFRASVRSRWISLPRCMARPPFA
jgi:hypothetical protein